MAVMDGPLEPSASTASNVTDMPDDPAFVNFFSTAITTGNASSATVAEQPYQCSTSVLLPSLPVSIATPTVPTVQTPSLPLLASAPIMPIFDAPDFSSNRATNLVKPSSPTAYARVMPPVSSSIPTAPPLNHSVSLQRLYGVPLLQPFPPPNPPPSLTPASIPAGNYGPVTSKDEVRDALLVLVQPSFFSWDNQFIDMVYRVMLNAHHS